MSFRKASIYILAVVLIHIIAIGTGLYGILPWWDMPMHLAGGFVIGMLGVAIHHSVTDKHHNKKSTPAWHHYLFIVGFVMLVAVAWEFHEYVLDNTVVIWYDWAPQQLSVTDTLGDLLLGGVGGLTAARFFRKQR